MKKITTGINGLNEVLNSGFIPGRSYLISGGAGTGKTTLGFHFLHEGIKNNEKCLFITLGENRDSLVENALSVDIDISKVDILDLSPDKSFYENQESYSIFTSEDVDKTPIGQSITDYIHKNKPDRIFLDSMTMLQYLSSDNYQFRKYVLAFTKFITNNKATFLFTAEPTGKAPDDELKFLSDGSITLINEPSKRMIYVNKFRGSDFRKGLHSMKLSDKGMEIYPQLIAKEHHIEFVKETISSGIPEIDELLNGGIERGTVTIVTGPSGVGKTTLGIQFMKEAAGRGERSVIFTFEETIETLVNRSESINIPIKKMQSKGTLEIYQIEPLLYSADEFTSLVREEIEKKHTQIVMIDSISGLKLSINESELKQRLHALMTYLRNTGVSVFLINEMENITGQFKATDVNISYLADNIIFLRYVEIKGELQKTLGVLKKRLSNFERTIRQFEITKFGLKVGEPLRNLQGILSGNPEILDLKKNKGDD